MGMSAADRAVEEVVNNLFEHGLASQNEDGTITLKGTEEQLALAGIDPDKMHASLMRQYKHITGNELPALESRRDLALQEVAHLAQKLGQEPELRDDHLYFMENPGGARPLGITGMQLRQVINDRDSSGERWWKFLSSEQMKKYVKPDGSADVDMVVGYDPDPPNAMTMEVVETDERGQPIKTRWAQF